MGTEGFVIDIALHLGFALLHFVIKLSLRLIMPAKEFYMSNGFVFQGRNIKSSSPGQYLGCSLRFILVHW